MSIVIRDPGLQSQFSGVAEAALCDASGNPLGHFISPELFRELLHRYAESQISIEELDRRFHEPGGSTLQQIWARLEAS